MQTSRSAAMNGDMDEESLTPGEGADAAMDGDMDEVGLLLPGEAQDSGVEDIVEMEAAAGVPDMVDSAAGLIDHVLAALPELGRADQILPAWETA